MSIDEDRRAAPLQTMPYGEAEEKPAGGRYQSEEYEEKRGGGYKSEDK